MCNKCCKCCCDNGLTINDLLKGQHYKVIKSSVKTVPVGSIIMCFSVNELAGNMPLECYRGVIVLATGNASEIEYNLKAMRFERI